jgi:hypothetical protein
MHKLRCSHRPWRWPEYSLALLWTFCPVPCQCVLWPKELYGPSVRLYHNPLSLHMQPTTLNLLDSSEAECSWVFSKKKDSLKRSLTDYKNAKRFYSSPCASNYDTELNQLCLGSSEVWKVVSTVYLKGDLVFMRILTGLLHLKCSDYPACRLQFICPR